MHIRNRLRRLAPALVVGLVVLSVIVAFLILHRMQLLPWQSTISSSPPVDIDPQSVVRIVADRFLAAHAYGTYPNRPQESIVLQDKGAAALIRYLKSTSVCKPPTTKSIARIGDLTIHLLDGSEVWVGVNTAQSTSLFGRHEFWLMFEFRGPGANQEVWSEGGTVCGTVGETVEELYSIIRAVR